MIAVTDKLAWYVARSSGIVAWATVTASILWGLTLSSRLVRKRGVPAWLLDLHRYLGTLSLVFVLIHLGGLWADNFVYFGWRNCCSDAVAVEDRCGCVGNRCVLLPRRDPDHLVVDAPHQAEDLARDPPHQHCAVDHRHRAHVSRRSGSSQHAAAVVRPRFDHSRVAAHRCSASSRMRSAQKWALRPETPTKGGDRSARVRVGLAWGSTPS